MKKIFNLKKNKGIRRKLRKEPIKAERLLWTKIKNNQLGYKFRRQHGIKNYIVDFYCPTLKLVIEIDGATHITEEEIKSDKIRQGFIESLGLKVARYTNHQIMTNMDFVLDDIIRMCRELSD